MKLQKIILCAAIALSAFGASLGILEIGGYLRSAFAPAVSVEIEPPEPAQPPVFSPPTFTDVRSEPAAAIEQPVPEEEAEPEDWGNTGDYFIVDENPKGFEDFSNLNIVDHIYDVKQEKPVKVKPYGVIEIAREGDEYIKEYKFSSININGQRVSVVTRAKGGVSFRFDGKFTEENMTLKYKNGDEYEETIYLKGRLTKWRGGVKIAEANVRFGISHGC
ncbi:MAG TPA: hypothetical protein VIL74_14560 [Pyrinomonadaceae bacterium]|jgi:hypothetical protein